MFTLARYLHKQKGTWIDAAVFILPSVLTFMVPKKSQNLKDNM